MKHVGFEAGVALMEDEGGKIVRVPIAEYNAGDSDAPAEKSETQVPTPKLTPELLALVEEFVTEYSEEDLEDAMVDWADAKAEAEHQAAMAKAKAELEAEVTAKAEAEQKGKDPVTKPGAPAK
jgi:hypothetical protein